MASGWHKRFAKFKNQNSKIKNRFERRFFYDNIELPYNYRTGAIKSKTVLIATKLIKTVQTILNKVFFFILDVFII